MANLELLFNRGTVRRLAMRSSLARWAEIERTPDEHVLTAEAGECAAALAERYALIVPILDVGDRQEGSHRA